MQEKILDLRKPKKEETKGVPHRETYEETKDGGHNHKVYISWEAHEYDNIQKQRGWFIVLAAGAVVLVALAVWLKNYFFAVFILIAAILVGWFAKKEPRNMHFAITSEGVQIGERLYFFDDLKSFWIFYDPPLFNELSVESKKTFMPRLSAPLGDANPEQIREELARFLPEEKQSEPFISILSRLLRF